MALLDDINQKIALIGECVDDIGEAANTKGAGIDLEYDRLTEWAGKIEAMDVPVYEFKGLTADAALNLVVGDVFTFPVQMDTGVPPNRTINLVSNTATAGAYLPLFLFTRVRIPSYFETTNIVVTTPPVGSGGTTTTVLSAALRYIDINSRFITNCHLNANGYLREINLNEVTDNNGSIVQVTWANNQTYKDELPLAINAPKMTGTLAIGINSYASSGSMKPIFIDAPYATIFRGATRANSTTVYTTLDGPGQFCLPSVRTIGGIWIPTDASHVLEMRFPRITRVNTLSHGNNGSETFIGSGRAGTTNLYLGPDVNYFAIYGLSAPGDSRIHIHIPAGDSTTKTTLDTAGFTYVQDYDYEPDLTEGA